MLQSAGADASLCLWQQQAASDGAEALAPFYAPVGMVQLLVMLSQFSAGGDSRGMEPTGRIIYSAASGQLLLEQALRPGNAAAEPLQHTHEICLPRQDDAYVSMVVWSLVKQLQLDHVQWLDHAFVHEHGENIAGAIQDVEELAQCYQGRALIVVDMEEVAGLAPVSCTTTSSRTAGQSRTSSASHSTGLSVASMLSYGQNISRQLGRSETSSATLTEGVVVSESSTEGSSTTQTVGSSDSTGTSVSAGFSFFSGFSTSVSTSSTHTDFRSSSASTSASTTKGNAQSSSTTRAQGQGQSETRGQGENRQKSKTHSAQEQETTTEAQGRSVSASDSVSVNVQAQHPQALAAVLSLASRVNRVCVWWGIGRWPCEGAREGLISF